MYNKHLKLQRNPSQFSEKWGEASWEPECTARAATGTSSTTATWSPSIRAGTRATTVAPRLPDCDSQILILIACWSNQNWLFSTILPMVTSLSLLHDFFNIIGFYCSLYYFFRFALSFSNPFHFIGKQQFPDITLPHIFLVTTPQNGFIAGLDYWPDLFCHWWSLS